LRNVPVVDMSRISTNKLDGNGTKKTYEV
jgi:hypothetical protein